jgi:DNA-binding NtrC family response regulator
VAIFDSKFVGESSAMQDVLSAVEKISQTENNVLITGESGTGKELVAKAIHEASIRCDQPMIMVQCGAISKDLLEAELFGCIQGIFGDEGQHSVGRFELAQNGTIFLNQVTEIPLHLQVRLLNLMQIGRFKELGSSREVEVNVRVIAATHQNLEEAVAKGDFLEDLYRQLSLASISLPPLRERKKDIPELIHHFVQKFNQITGHCVEAPSGQILEALMVYEWPGNVRELENLMERLVILKGQGSVDLSDLPHRIFQKHAENRSDEIGSASEWGFPKMVLPHMGLNLKAIVTAFENHLVDQALSRTNGNKNRASELLNMNRTTLVEKLRKRGMIVPAALRSQGSLDSEETLL